MCAPWMRREGSALKVENYLLVRVTTVILSHSARPRKTVYGMSSSAATPLLNGISMILTPNKKCSPCLRIGVHHVSGRKRQGGVDATSRRISRSNLLHDVSRWATVPGQGEYVDSDTSRSCY